MKFPAIAKFVNPGRYARLITALLLSLFMVTKTASAAELCETIIQDAYKQLDELCSTVGRNQVCYGNDSIRTELNLPYEAEMFSKIGDKAPVIAIRELYTLPMDTSTKTWGLSLMKVQTNLPDTAPGQNVVFVLYGDTHLTNADDEGKMSAFYFTSGLGQPACTSVPADGITIRSPKGTRVQFKANGVDIDIGSTVVLQAEPNKQMKVQLIEGSAKITAQNKTESLTPGQSLTVPLGGVNGLQAIGTPSIPVTEPESQAHQNFMNAIPNATATTSPNSGNIGQPPKPTKDLKPPKDPPKPPSPPKPPGPPKK